VVVLLLLLSTAYTQSLDFTPEARPYTTILGEGLEGEPQVGGAFAIVQEFDGDGMAELVFAGPSMANDGRADCGAIWVLGAAQLESGQVLYAGDFPALYCQDEESNLGGVVASAGDLDSDGLDEILVAAPDRPGDDGASGTVYVLGGRRRAYEESRIDAASPNGMLVAAANQQGFAQSLAVCDLNDDGRSDLVIGAPETDDSSGTNHIGRIEGYLDLAYMIGGRVAMGDDRAPLFQWWGEEEGTELGDRIACGTDPHGQKVIFGASGDCTGTCTRPEGWVGEWLRTGDAYPTDGTLLETASLLWSTPISFSGRLEVASGDLDGDGWVDLILGVAGFNGRDVGCARGDAGAVAIRYGGPDGWSSGPVTDFDALLCGPHADAGFGRAVAGSAMTNGALLKSPRIQSASGTLPNRVTLRRIRVPS
jgi:hypothetical protein